MVAIRVGEADIVAVRAGEAEALAVYHGAEEVWSAVEPITVSYIASYEEIGDDPTTSLSLGDATEHDVVVNLEAGADSGVPDTPAGWTSAVTAGNIRISVRKLPSGVTTVPRGNDNSSYALRFRPSRAFDSIDAVFTGQYRTDNPGLQSVLCGGLPGPVIVVGIAMNGDGTGISFSTASPAFDAVDTNWDGLGGVLAVGRKIYQTNPLDHAIDMNDLGSANWLFSGYIRLIG